jgi:hypothetical protein
MHHPPLIRVLQRLGPRLLLVLLAPVVAGLGACLPSELVDVGSNFDASLPPPESSVAPESEASLEDATVPPDSAPDVDASDVADVDSGPAPIVRELCIPNPSFETVPPDDADTATPVLTEPPGWQACSGSSSASASSCSLQATNGSTYLGLSVGFPFLSATASVDFQPCSPIEIGATYSLAVDLALDAPNADGGQAGEPPALQLRGSNTACDLQGDLLWRFSGPASACGWKTACGTFVANASYSHLLLVPETSSSTAIVFLQTNVLVDNFVSLDDGCPAR